MCDTIELLTYKINKRFNNLRQTKEVIEFKKQYDIESVYFLCNYYKEKNRNSKNEYYKKFMFLLKSININNKLLSFNKHCINKNEWNKTIINIEPVKKVKWKICECGKQMKVIFDEELLKCLTCGRFKKANGLTRYYEPNKHKKNAYFLQDNIKIKLEYLQGKIKPPKKLMKLIEENINTVEDEYYENIFIDKLKKYKINNYCKFIPYFKKYFYGIELISLTEEEYKKIYFMISKITGEYTKLYPYKNMFLANEIFIKITPYIFKDVKRRNLFKIDIKKPSYLINKKNYYKWKNVLNNII